MLTERNVDKQIHEYFTKTFHERSLTEMISWVFLTSRLYATQFLFEIIDHDSAQTKCMKWIWHWNEMKWNSIQDQNPNPKIDHQISNRDKPCRSVLYTLEGLDCVMLDTWHRCIQPDLTGTCQGVETSTLRPKHVGWPRPRASELLGQQKAGRPSPWILAKCSIKEDQVQVILCHLIWSWRVRMSISSLSCIKHIAIKNTNEHDTCRCLPLIDSIINHVKASCACCLKCLMISQSVLPSLLSSSLKALRQSTLFNVCLAYFTKIYPNMRTFHLLHARWVR